MHASSPWSPKPTRSKPKIPQAREDDRKQAIRDTCLLHTSTVALTHSHMPPRAFLCSAAPLRLLPPTPFVPETFSLLILQSPAHLATLSRLLYLVTLAPDATMIEHSSRSPSPPKEGGKWSLLFTRTFTTSRAHLYYFTCPPLLLPCTFPVPFYFPAPFLRPSQHLQTQISPDFNVLYHTWKSAGIRAVPH